MWYKAYFKQGTDTLDISSGSYKLAEFDPPIANEAPVFAETTGINRREGSERTDLEAQNMEISFGLHISGDTEADVSQARKRVGQFLRRAGNETKPLYLCFLPHDYISKEPIFGQRNASTRLEVIFGTIAPSDKYGVGDLRSRAEPNCRVSLVVKPYPLGADHVFAQALGLVYSDVYPKDADGRSKGVKVGPSVVNLVSNPSGETNTTGWTKSASLETFERSSKEALYGKWSFRMAETQSGGANEFFGSTDFITGITASSKYVFSAAIKKTIFPAAQTGFMRIDWYTSGDVFISFSSINLDAGEHDWKRYYVIGTAPGTAAKAKLYVSFPDVSGYSFEMYVDGIMLTNTVAPVPYHDGSFRSSAWAGAAHNSVSTSEAGKLYYKWTRLFPNPREATICIQWTPDYNSSDLPTGMSQKIFVASGIDFQLAWASSGNIWQFWDGTNFTNSAATSFTKGTPVDLGLVLKDNTARIYVNGVQSGSTGTYKPNATDGGWLYIGSDNSGTNQISGTFNGLQVYKDNLTATEMAADHANMLPLLQAGRRVDWLSYVWGSIAHPVLGTVKWTNCNDNAVRTNFIIAGEVPGSVEARIIMKISTGVNVSTVDWGGIFLSRMLVPEGYLLGRFLDFYGELQGTADPNSSSGEYYSAASLGTSELWSALAIAMSETHIDILSGQEIALLCRVYDAVGANLQLALLYHFNDTNVVFRTDWKPVESTNKFLSRLTRFITFIDIRQGLSQLEGSPFLFASAGFRLVAKRSSGSGEYRLDYYQIVTKPTMRIYNEYISSTPNMIYDSRTHRITPLDSSNLIGEGWFKIEGDVFELMPEMENYLIWAAGDIKRKIDEVVYNDLATIVEMIVTPRWGSLV